MILSRKNNWNLAVSRRC